MTSPLSAPDILRHIEADADASIGNAFVALAAEYFAQTREREDRVFTAHSPAELAAPFDEPLPADGTDVAEVLARVRDEVIPDSNHLFHPRYVGHQTAGP